LWCETKFLFHWILISPIVAALISQLKCILHGGALKATSDGGPEKNTESFSLPESIFVPSKQGENYFK
jgi:hypothetical protein